MRSPDITEIQIGQLFARTEKRLERRGKGAGPSTETVAVTDPRGEAWFERLDPEIRQTILDSMRRSEQNLSITPESKTVTQNQTSEIIIRADKDITLGTQPDSTINGTQNIAPKPPVRHWSHQVTARGIRKGFGRYSFRSVGSRA